MIFPLKGDVPSRSWPVVTIGLIGLNVLAFLYQVSLGIDARGPGAGAAEAFIVEFGVTPCRLTHSCPIDVSRLLGDFPHPWATIFTSMFLHGGLGHLLANTWFLWLFGNNVEEAYGHLRYAALYLAGGIVATMVFVVINPNSTVPLVGASGAIAAVMGAYAVLFPRHKVATLLGWIVISLPAFLYLVIWFLLQFTLGGSNTAWEAHVGGFVFGALFSLVFRSRLAVGLPAHTSRLA